MKQRLLAITLFSMLSLAACGSPVERFNNDGNEAYNNIWFYNHYVITFMNTVHDYNYYYYNSYNSNNCKNP